MTKRLKIMLTTEGTYPFHQGGVSTWCEILVNKFYDMDFVIYSVMTDPFITQKFRIPSNASIIRMPLWGTEEPAEHLNTPFSLIYLKKKKTKEKVLKTEFLPLFSKFIEEILSEKKNPEWFGQILVKLHRFFMLYEYKVSFKSQVTWIAYKELILQLVQDKKYKLDQPDIYGLIQSLGWVYRFFNIVNTPIPDVDITHSSAAAFCGIPCVLSKLTKGTPYLLTEHGVYLREQYLSLSKRVMSPFLNTFLVRLVHSITELNFHFADQISPVCEYNTRWERRFTQQIDKIKVIYNGVNQHIFTEAEEVSHPNPTVVSMARIDPIKDIITLMKSAAIVREKIPRVLFRVYGSISVPEYYEECLKLHKELNLEGTFEFVGHTSNMVAAYHSGDVVALSSISEAFPYSVVEAMMTGKAVVATEVGGIREALGETGVLVPPSDPERMASGILSLLENKEWRSLLGREARDRALRLFTLDRVLDQYRKSYYRLYDRAFECNDQFKEAVRQRSVNQERNHVERAYAFLINQLYLQALEEFRKAILCNPESHQIPLYFQELAHIHKKMGNDDLAKIEIEKLNFWLPNQSFIKIYR